MRTYPKILLTAVAAVSLFVAASGLKVRGCSSVRNLRISRQVAEPGGHHGRFEAGLRPYLAAFGLHQVDDALGVVKDLVLVRQQPAFAAAWTEAFPLRLEYARSSRALAATSSGVSIATVPTTRPSAGLRTVRVETSVFGWTAVIVDPFFKARPTGRRCNGVPPAQRAAWSIALPHTGY